MSSPKTTYNQDNIKLFQRKDAVLIFLHPVNLLANGTIPANFDRQPANGDEQIKLFKALHFIKFRLANHSRQADRALHYAIRNRLMNINIGLVISLVQKLNGQMDDDLISLGYEALLRAIDAFDPWRGFRFSTYACHAIIRGINDNKPNKSVPWNDMFDEELDWREEKNDNRELALEILTHKLIQINELHKQSKNDQEIPQDQLTFREWQVLRHRFGLDGMREEGPKKLQTVGDSMGYSKETIRNLQKKAIEKLRRHLDKYAILK